MHNPQVREIDLTKRLQFGQDRVKKTFMLPKIIFSPKSIPPGEEVLKTSPSGPTGKE